MKLGSSGHVEGRGQRCGVTPLDEEQDRAAPYLQTAPSEPPNAFPDRLQPQLQFKTLALVAPPPTGHHSGPGDWCVCGFELGVGPEAPGRHQMLNGLNKPLFEIY